MAFPTEPRRRWQVVLIASALVGTAACSGTSGRGACERAVADPTDDAKVAACRVAAARPGAATDLASLGYVYLVRDELEEAETTARALLDGPLAGDGHLLLCQVMSRDQRGDAAYDHGQRAHEAHQRDPGRQMRDALCMSQAAWQSGQFADALTAADSAVGLASTARDQAVEVQAHLARADVLRRTGAHREARQALEKALERATTACERAWIHLKAGMLRSEAEENGLAAIEFDQAVEANRACREPLVAHALPLNRAALRVRDDPAAAIKILDEYEASYPSDEPLFESLLLRGLSMANLGDRAAAAALIDQAAARKAPDADWPWEIESARADLAAAGREPADAVDAERHYRRSIELVAALRTTAPAHSAFLLASHRAPFDGLITLLARQGRWLETLTLVLELDAGDMLRANARPSDASQISAPSAAATVAAWRGRDLIIVLAPTRRHVGTDDEPVIQLRVVDGRVSGQVLGSATAARAAAATLYADPDHVASAQALGALIVPDDARTDTLQVLLIGALGKVPLAALRDRRGALVAARRPLARALSIRPRAVAPATRDRAVVLADPLGDLASARLEGETVARLVGTEAHLAGAATIARLDDARDAALLHVAAHIAARGRWRSLRLADGEVSPADIVAKGLAPRLAVLASCGSGAADDEEGWGSIASALLASGTAVVVATDRSVDDAAAYRMVSEFYAQPDWAADPIRALARVQVDQAARGVAASEWAVFGALQGPAVAPP